MTVARALQIQAIVKISDAHARNQPHISNRRKRSQNVIAAGSDTRKLNVTSLNLKKMLSKGRGGPNVSKHPSIVVTGEAEPSDFQ